MLLSLRAMWTSAPPTLPIIALLVILLASLPRTYSAVEMQAASSRSVAPTPLHILLSVLLLEHASLIPVFLRCQPPLPAPLLGAWALPALAVSRVFTPTLVSLLLAPAPAPVACSCRLPSPFRLPLVAFRPSL